MNNPSLIFAQQNSPGNFLVEQEDLSLRIQELEVADSPQYEEITEGRLTIADLILSPALSVLVTDPNDLAYTGAFMAGNGIDFSGTRYVLGQVVEGQLQVGFVEDGGLTALGGNLVVDSTGLSIYGLNLAQYFQATNDGETRRSYLGMYLPQGETVPVFSIILTGDVGTNLLTNGDAETGDLTGWTDSDSVWSASTLSPYEGSYSFFHDGTLGGFPGYLLQNVSVTAGDIVSVEFAHRRIVGILSGRLVLAWKDGGASVIQTDYMYGTNADTWAAFAQNFIAPATTASLDMYWQVGDPFNDEEIDVLDIYISDVTNELRWTDDTLLAVVNGVEYDLLNNDLLFASNQRTDISTSGATTVFSLILPANFFTNNHLEYSLDAWTDANANARNLTAVTTLGATTNTVVSMTGANANRVHSFRGSIGKGGTNVQDIFACIKRINNNESGNEVVEAEYVGASETESGTIAFSLTLGLNGSVDAGWYNNVQVRKVKNT